MNNNNNNNINIFIDKYIVYNQIKFGCRFIEHPYEYDV